MSKKRNFSVFLLKEGYNENNALKDEHNLQKCEDANQLPENSILYIMDSVPKSPWWKYYFEISDDLFQSLKSAILFVPTESRCFAFTFGHSRHYLKDTSYEYDFGLIVTLNCLDSEKLKSTDILEPGIARRQRIQTPIDSNLTYFDVDNNSDVIKKLTGKVKNEYSELFDTITGAESLHIGMDRKPDELVELCKKLLELYNKEDYKTVFPDINNIRPVKDPEKVQELNLQLLEAIKGKNEKILLTIPDIVDYERTAKIIFSHYNKEGAVEHQNASVDSFYDFLREKNIEINEVADIEHLKEYYLHLKDENNNSIKKFNILKCLLFDIEEQDGQIHHFCEGNWYKIDGDYVRSLQHYLDRCFVASTLADYTHGTEGEYNHGIAENNSCFLCLDCENISPTRQSKVEPCDLYIVEEEKAVFYHVKKSTTSSTLSHHFNQGVNSIELLKSEEESRNKLIGLIEVKMGNSHPSYTNYIEPISCYKYKVIYAIITSKDGDRKSANLPIFSRISLRRAINTLRRMEVAVECMFIKSHDVKIK